MLEILLSITLISVVMVVMFDALSRIRESENRIKRRKSIEKNVYLFYNYMSQLVKNMSAVRVFNNRNKTVFFFGDGDEMTFISKSPLFFPHRVHHFVHLESNQDRIEFQEIFFNSEKNYVSFDIFEEGPQVLLNNIRHLELLYYCWDRSFRRFEWKRTLNSFEGDSLPTKIMMRFTLANKDYTIVFSRHIHETYQVIPELLLK